MSVLHKRSGGAWEQASLACWQRHTRLPEASFLGLSVKPYIHTADGEREGEKQRKRLFRLTACRSTCMVLQKAWWQKLLLFTLNEPKIRREVNKVLSRTPNLSKPWARGIKLGTSPLHFQSETPTLSSASLWTDQSNWATHLPSISSYLWQFFFHSWVRSSFNVWDGQQPLLKSFQTSPNPRALLRNRCLKKR